MRTLRLAVLVFLCVTVAASAVAARRARAGSLDEGMALYRKADFAGALKRFDDAAQQTGDKAARARAYQYAALMHVALGKSHYALAARDIHSMVATDPQLRPDPEEFPEAYMRLYYQTASENRGLAEPPKPGLTTLAIMDFDNNSVGEGADKYAALGRGLSQMLITDLVEVPALRLVEREKINFVLDELKLQKSGHVDAATAVRVGKVVGAQALLFGGAMVMDKDMKITWRLVKVETGEILKAGETEGSAKKFFELEKKLAVALAQDLKVEVSDEALKKIEGSEQPNLDAALAYSEGLKHLDEGHTQAAYQKFEQASKLDPKFAAAKRRMTKIRPLTQAS